MARGKVKQTNIDKRIEKVYTTPSNPGSFGGLEAVYNAVNSDGGKFIPKSRVKKWLITNRAFSLHRQPKRKFLRRKVIVSSFHQQWQTDLIIVDKIADENGGYKYIMVAIDVFSRYAHARPLLKKEGKHVRDAFQDIKDSGAVLPKIIQSDKGKEYHNSLFREWCDNNNIKHFSSEDDAMKSQIAERFISTLQNRLSRMMRQRNNNVWIDDLQDVVYAINHSHNNAIGTSPASVDFTNHVEIFHRLYKPPSRVVSVPNDTFKEGQHVRLLSLKKTFDKGYRSRWTHEIFVITGVFFTADGRIRFYTVKDMNNEKIHGTFYHFELQPTSKPGYKIDQIYSDSNEDSDYKLVKWLDLPSSKNSYVKKKDLKRYL